MRLSDISWLQESEPESKAEAVAQPEGELRIEAEQLSSGEGAAASRTAAAKFEEPPSKSEVMPFGRRSLFELLLAGKHLRFAC